MQYFGSDWYVAVTEVNGHIWHYGPYKTDEAARYLARALRVQSVHRGTWKGSAT